VRTIKELFQLVQDSDGTGVVEGLQKEIEKIRPAVIANMIRTPKDKNASRIIRLVAEKYLMVHPSDPGSVVYDEHIDKSVSDMVPLTKLDQSSEAVACVYEIVMKLM